MYINRERERDVILQGVYCAMLNNRFEHVCICIDR